MSQFYGMKIHCYLQDLKSDDLQLIQIVPKPLTQTATSREELSVLFEEKPGQEIHFYVRKIRFRIFLFLS